MMKVKQNGDVVVITVTGELHVAMTYDFTDVLVRFSDVCDEFQINMGGVARISQGGLSVLAMFVSHIKRHGRAISITRYSHEVAEQLAFSPLFNDVLTPQPKQQVGSEKVIAMPSTPYRLLRHNGGEGATLQHAATVA